MFYHGSACTLCYLDLFNRLKIRLATWRPEVAETSAAPSFFFSSFGQWALRPVPKDSWESFTVKK